MSTAAFPAGVGAPVQYGPRVRALGIYLIARQHLPYDRAAQLFFDWFGVQISTGTLATFVAQGAEDLQPFLDEVHRQISVAPVVGFDETGARVDGKLRWLHTASTPTLTSFSLHDRRGGEGIDHAAVLPGFTGTAIHDGWAPYRKYPTATHALCNAHHLRELLGVIEQAPAGTQAWAVQMDRLLRELHHRVREAEAAGHHDLEPLQLAQIRAAYTQIIARGHQENPPPTIRTGRRGPIRRSVALNLLSRLDRDREHVLRFAHDFQVPFDNNQAERDIRMVKIQQKISGCWRTLPGADGFLALRAYLSTSGKQGQHPLHALTRLATGDPWLPAT